MIEPGIHDAEGRGVEPVDPVAAVTAFFDQARAPQQTEVLGDRGTRNGKGPGDTARWKGASAQQI